MTPFPRDSYQPLRPYAPDRRPIEVDLSDNTSRWGTHPAALDVIRGARPEDLILYPPVYADALRAAVARRFGVPIETVATGCGSDDLLDSGFRAICDPGEAVAYMPPTFSMIEIFARMNALHAVPVVSDDQHGVPDPERLVAAAGSDPGGPAQRRRGLVYICRPNNPTGEVQPRAWVEAVVEAAGSNGPVIFVDEAYSDYSDDSLIGMAAASDRVVVLRTLSKAYGLAGMRIGFAVGAPGVITEIEKSRGPYKVSRLAERAAVAALEDRDGWVTRVIADTLMERRYLTEELEARGFRPLPSGGNFLLLPLPSRADEVSLGDDAPDRAIEITAALRDAGVAVRPFPALPGLGDCIRISIGPRREMDRFLESLLRLPEFNDR